MKQDNKNVMISFLFNFFWMSLLLIVITSCSLNSKSFGRCEKGGFEVNFNNPTHERAFIFYRFERDREGHFDVNLEIKLNELTHSNGFVANHMWFKNEVDELSNNVVFPEIGKDGDGGLIFDKSSLTPEKKWESLLSENKVGAKIAGVPPAPLENVFTDQSIEIGQKWLRQVKGYDDNTNVTKFSIASPNPQGGAVLTPQGDSSRGGWQELFTIVPCKDMQMLNGFTMANLRKIDYSKPKISYVRKPEGKKVVVRLFHNRAMLIDSFVSAGYADDAGSSATGLFTIQHYGETDPVTSELKVLNLNSERNILTTKGALVCRSMALFRKLKDDETLNDLEAPLKSYFGPDEVLHRGLGMTCYLGLTALWPEAVEEASNVAAIHKKQFEDKDKRELNKYDVSDKTMTVLMVDTKDTAINSDLLKPIFGDVFSDTSGDFVDGLPVEDGEKALEALLEHRDFDYLFGRIHISFDYKDSEETE